MEMVLLMESVKFPPDVPVPARMPVDGVKENPVGTPETDGVMDEPLPQLTSTMEMATPMEAEMGLEASAQSTVTDMTSVPAVLTTTVEK